MKIRVLTYDHPHRKTQDVLMHLKARGYEQVEVWAIPWEERKIFQSLFRVKPEPFDLPLQRTCSNLGYALFKAPIDDSAFYGSGTDRGLMLIAGAPILPEEFVEANTVINAHCGWLPDVRGLDSLKWAIFYDRPIGVTTHIVDANVDLGLLIERAEIPIDPMDSLYSLALRQYEKEISMLIDAIDKYKEAKPFSEPAVNPPTRRMPHKTELVMMKKFEALKGGMYSW